MTEIYEGVCATYANAYMMAPQIIQVGYYWLTLGRDYIEYFRIYHKCQIYANKKHASTLPLYDMVVS